MTDDVRISRIQNATTAEELQKATDGYSDQAVVAHPALRRCEGFVESMNTGQFFRALEHVRRAAASDGDEYGDVIRMLDFAAAKELAIKMS